MQYLLLAQTLYHTPPANTSVTPNFFKLCPDAFIKRHVEQTYHRNVGFREPPFVVYRRARTKVARVQARKA